MKIKEGYVLKKIDGNNTIVPENGLPPLNATITLNESSAFLWRYLKEHNATKEEMFNALLENFDLSTVLALNDIEMFLKTLNEFNILE